MPYTKQTWTDAPSTSTPISAARLNHVEDGVETAQNTAETAQTTATAKYTKPGGGIPSTDLSTAAQTSLGKADTAVQPGGVSAVGASGAWNDITGKPAVISAGATQTDARAAIGAANITDTPVTVPVGIGAFLWFMTSGQRTTALNKIVPTLNKAGTEVVVRETLYWSEVQPTEGGSFVWTTADAIATACANAGVKIWWILSHPPNWATAAGSATSHAAWPCPPYDGVTTAGGNSALDAYVAFSKAAVARYGPGGTFWDSYSGTDRPTTHWEVWNEEYTTLASSRWNGSAVVAQYSSPTNYAKIYNRVSQALQHVPGVVAVASVTDKVVNAATMGTDYLNALDRKRHV